MPYAYGQLDVVRARRGDAPWDVVRHGYHARNVLTRLLARLALSLPPLSRPLRALLLLAAQAAYRAAPPRPGLRRPQRPLQPAVPGRRPERDRHAGRDEPPGPRSRD